MSEPLPPSVPGPASPANAGGGDRAALDELLARNLPLLHAFIRLRAGPKVRAFESCSDLVQSVCRELVEDLPGLSFPNDASLRAWLFQTALNKVRSRGRHLGRQRRDPDRVIGGSLGAELVEGYAVLGTPSAAAMSAEQIDRLERAFDRLSEDQREVITLARLAGLPLAEVGSAMGGRSPAAVSMLLGRALAALDRLLQTGEG